MRIEEKSSTYTCIRFSRQDRILTATLSVYNSMVYSNSRLLYGMASEGNAPRSLMQVNRRGVPVRALVSPAIFPAPATVISRQ